MKRIADLTVEATVLSYTSANSKNLSVHLKVLYGFLQPFFMILSIVLRKNL